MSAVLSTFSNYTKAEWVQLAQETTATLPGGALTVLGASLGAAYVIKYLFMKRDKYAPGPYVQSARLAPLR